MHPEQDEIFTQIYKKYFNQIKLYIMSSVSDPHLAEEIAQDTFHTAMMKMDEVMAVEPIAWLKKTAKYKTLNEQRKRMRYLKLFLSLDDPVASQVVTESRVEDVIITEEERHQHEPLAKQIHDALTPDERILLQRAILDRVPYLQVAEELEISLWNCQKRVQRLRKKLKKKFPQYNKENFKK